MSVKIGSRLVGDGHPCFVIAEIGINHNGSLKIARQLIDVAVEAGCNAVKFQKRTVEVVYSQEELEAPRKVDPSIIQAARERSTLENVHYQVLSPEAIRRLEADPSATTNGDLKSALEFNEKAYDIIDQYCRERGILWSASSWDGLSAHFINGFNPAFHKIASACLTNRDILKRVRDNGKPVILSTGGSTIEQIIKAVDILGREDLVIMHCVATYPSEDRELNLSVIHTLKRMFPGVPIGYSGHEKGIDPSVWAVVEGACIIERHITLDRKMPGSDQSASLEPHELKELVTKVRRYEEMRGDGVKRVYPGEETTMKKLRRRDDINEDPAKHKADNVVRIRSGPV
ncbi:MAG: N-acetylneuraminate synthase family protein [Candidatus Yanofskybacteria bacterium]|nr:N-acetylneuraminate synthase family protein [Candidatus Yanofskybacteria bacterium]